jgi:hypothetical protein
VLRASERVIWEATAWSEDLVGAAVVRRESVDVVLVVLLVLVLVAALAGTGA